MKGRSRATGVKRSYIYSVLGRATVQVIQLSVTIALARILAPSDFGLVAYVTMLVGFATLFSEFGIGAALVHTTRTDDAYRSSAFWFSAGLNIILTAGVLGLAPLIAKALGEPQLRGLLMLGSLNFALSLSVVQIAILQRTMQFLRLAAAEVGAALLGGTVAVCLAARGMGPHSLVAGTLVTTSSLTLITWLLTAWRPRYRFRRQDAREIWHYSRGLIYFHTVNYFARNGDNLVIGVALGATALGFYSRAYSLMALPIFLAGSALGRVSFPALARATRVGPQELEKTYARVLRGTTVIGFPIAAGLACIAQPLILVAFGDEWAPAIPVLIALAVSAPPQIYNSTMGALLQATGETRLLFRLGLLGAVLVLVSASIGISFGIVGVAVAYAVQAYLNCAVVVSAVFRTLRFRRGALLRPIMPAVTSTMAMSLCTLLVVAAVRGHTSFPTLLLTTVTAGGLSYVAFLRWAHPRAWFDVVPWAARKSTGETYDSN